MESAEMNPPSSAYPARLDIEYPERNLNRLTTAFRIVLIIPIAIVASLVSGDVGNWDASPTDLGGYVGLGGVLFLPTLLMLLFRQKYPRWWFDWNLELSRFWNRVGIYLGLM